MLIQAISIFCFELDRDIEFLFLPVLEVEKRQQYQKFVWSVPREKSEKGLIYYDKNFKRIT